MAPTEDLINDIRHDNLDKPIVFISYASEELALADFIKKIIIRWTEDRIEPFVAKRDIPPGDNPLKTMMENKLKHAQAIIPICSIKSQNSSWVWWESAAVWAKDNKVYPLFTNISASDFGPPLTLVTQGKDYFVEEDFVNTIVTICRELKIKVKDSNLIEEEIIEYKGLNEKHSKPETPAGIIVKYKKLESKDVHKYSLIFEVENKTQKKFNDVVIELYFPEDYIDGKKQWDYPHLRSSNPKDKPGYLCLMFSFSALPDQAKNQFDSSLLSGKKLKLFGEENMTIARFHYVMNDSLWRRRFDYAVQWKVYINGGVPIEGSRPLDEFCNF